jgi:F-type H+-transporting ATPase subunit gamma
MPNTKEILGRIKSVQNIQQITRAMKMIASARIKKVEKLLKSSKPYCAKLREIIEEALGRVEELTHPLTMKRPVKTVGLLVVTGDKGLCGPYNMNVIRAVDRFMRNQGSGKKVVFYVIGTKALRHFSRRQVNIRKSYVSWTAKESFAEEVAHFLVDEFTGKHFDELHCIYTQSISMLTQRVSTEKILPLEQKGEKRGNVLFIFEPEPEVALNILLPLYMKELIMRIFLDSQTSEMASRLNAMSNATDNAEKLVGELRLHYFRARQENITTEILEIVSGAESLKTG